jgi:hypothetical protein
MNNVKNSLVENKDHILSSLPKELHEDFLKNIDEMSDEKEEPLKGDAAVSAIKAELKANPDVDEATAAAELKDIKAPEALEPVSEEEIEKQKAEMLKAAEAQGPNEDQD